MTRERKLEMASQEEENGRKKRTRKKVTKAGMISSLFLFIDNVVVICESKYKAEVI